MSASAQHSRGAHSVPAEVGELHPFQSSLESSTSHRLSLELLNALRPSLEPIGVLHLILDARSFPRPLGADKLHLFEPGAIEFSPLSQPAFVIRPYFILIRLRRHLAPVQGWRCLGLTRSYLTRDPVALPDRSRSWATPARLRWLCISQGERER